MLTTVTLTGADDTVDPALLIELSAEFPYVEWGVLLGSRGGVSRFPSAAWIHRLLKGKREAGHNVALSLHACGRLLREVVWQGRASAEVGLSCFGRMQLNFHGVPVAIALDADAVAQGQRDKILSNIAFAQTGTGIAEIIVQLDGVNDWILPALMERGVRASGLYDRSHGAGVLPDSWPKPDPSWKVGYAGGLGANNVYGEIHKILETIGSHRFWIDMESKLFVDGKFDPQQCRRVLETCKDILR